MEQDRRCRTPAEDRPAATPELTVVIPTRDRCAVLTETLARLGRQTGDVRFEVKVVDDGSRDATRDAVREFVASTAIDIELIEQAHCGPAVARNRAVAIARAPVCLFLNDDAWPRADLLERHRDFHRRNPEPQSALLGAMVLPRALPATPFMRWAMQEFFDYEGIDDPHSAGGGRFYSCNVSAKTGLLRQAGGFDEGFSIAGFEDIDLGLRLEELGMRLAYDADAIVEHFHPMDLAGTINRLRRNGSWLALFATLHPGWPIPRRPGARHRVKAFGLTLLAPISRSGRLQREIWRFLCHEASREGYWSAADSGQVARPEATGQLRIGRWLARVASRDENATMPTPRPLGGQAHRDDAQLVAEI